MDAFVQLGQPLSQIRPKPGQAPDACGPGDEALSIRYGISVILEPSFTGKVHRLRQTLCNQYATWAAEMHPVHLPLIDYLPCPEEMVQSVDAGLERVAGESRRIPLSQHRILAPPDAPNDICLDFADRVPPTSQAGRNVDRLRSLREAVIEILGRVYGLSPYLESHRKTDPASYPLRIPLMQHADLTPGVFESAVSFAQGVASSLELGVETGPWHLALIRFESDAAGEDWSAGGWAADLRWQIVSTHRLGGW